MIILLLVLKPEGLLGVAVRRDSEILGAGACATLPSCRRPLLALMGCKEDPNAPYLEFAGGGFIFNYRNAEAFYGFVAKPLRSLPEGSVIEAQFEVPNSATPYVITQNPCPA